MPKSDRLAEVRRAVERDAARARTPEKPGGFSRALALIGSVGWPIALLTGGGALLGHWLDARASGGVSATLSLLTAGAIAGSLLALRALREGKGP